MKRNSVAAMFVFASLALNSSSVAFASVETLVVTTDTRGMTTTERLKHACQRAQTLLADLDSQFGSDLRVSKGAKFQLTALAIEAYTCEPKRSH